jgi:hypothetical protein
MRRDAPKDASPIHIRVNYKEDISMKLLQE